jgi:hypothetical protein
MIAIIFILFTIILCNKDAESIRKQIAEARKSPTICNRDEFAKLVDLYSALSGTPGCTSVDIEVYESMLEIQLEPGDKDCRDYFITYTRDMNLICWSKHIFKSVYGWVIYRLVDSICEHGFTIKALQEWIKLLRSDIETIWKGYNMFKRFRDELLAYLGTVWTCITAGKNIIFKKKESEKKGDKKIHKKKIHKKKNNSRRADSEDEESANEENEDEDDANEDEETTDETRCSENCMLKCLKFVMRFILKCVRIVFITLVLLIVVVIVLRFIPCRDDL